MPTPCNRPGLAKPIFSELELIEHSNKGRDATTYFSCSIIKPQWFRVNENFIMYNKQRQPSLARIITADWRTVPWTEANEIYNLAAELAEETALTAYKQQIAEKYPDAQLNKLELPDKSKIRRKAGNKALVEVFIPRYKLDQFGVAMIAQIVAHLATLSIQTTGHGELILEDPYALESVKDLGSGMIGVEEPEYQDNIAVSGLEFVKQHFKTPEMMGLYRFLMLDSRSSYLTKQYTGDAKNYCSLVPLILSAFKRYHDIPYSAWNRNELKYVVNPTLCEAMLYEPPESSFTKDFLLEIRDQGLLWKSGPNAGKLRNPLHTHTLYGLKGTPFEMIPDLAQVMLTQIWCAHPDNRTKYMVLSPNNWDGIPVSLISPAVFLTPTYSNSNPDLPWDA